MEYVTRISLVSHDLRIIFQAIRSVTQLPLASEKSSCFFLYPWRIAIHQGSQIACNKTKIFSLFLMFSPTSENPSIDHLMDMYGSKSIVTKGKIDFNLNFGKNPVIYLSK